MFYKKKFKEIKYFIQTILVLLLIGNSLNSIMISNDFLLQTDILVDDSLNEPSIASSPLLNARTGRIAIYDEPNITKPDYVSGGQLNNNITNLKTTLEATGFDVTLITTDQIYKHQLATVDFDVFILPDNVPKENITEFVFEFWVGGGSILGFDGAASYLCYKGILPEESSGSDGYDEYWKFITQDITIKERHPVSKSYDLDDIIEVSTSIYYCGWNWTKLQETSIADDLSYIGQSDEISEYASVIALDPSTRGGKLYQLDMI